MRLTYWTTIEEPIDCIKSPFQCPISAYNKIFNAELELDNVDVKLWQDGRQSLELRLGFNQADVAGINTYDILKFNRVWDKKKLEGEWTCTDGHATEPD